jgi:Asp-tRNA(Asn)/Glu-tRNA(Gln) amidotransferase A subunit family amidase
VYELLLTCVYRRFDSLGLAARSLAHLRNVTADLQKGSGDFDQPRKVVLFEDLVKGLPTEQEEAFGDFVKTIEDSLDTKADRTTLGTIWNENPPKEADGQKLNEFINSAPFRSYCYDYAKEYKTFRSSYANRFDREPFAEANTRFRWQYGDNTTESEYNSDLERIDVFKAWFESNVMGTNSSTIVIFPYGISEPEYRQDKPGQPEPLNGITAEQLAPILGAPHLVVPFTEVSYKSKVTGRSEKLPVSASVLGPRGSDTSLIELVERAFKDAKWLTQINTGRSAFSL